MPSDIPLLLLSLGRLTVINGAPADIAYWNVSGPKAIIDDSNGQVCDIVRGLLARHITYLILCNLPDPLCLIRHPFQNLPRLNQLAMHLTGGGQPVMVITFRAPKGRESSA
ncbi:hypothetical protein BBK36DRAFT_1144411 [Trichoderma citrinoviride]|uniref:Uncharacterized protein n=1 Tax=Trichoderma citrinoviride TaxID=58853 RepID=A0A2T4B0M4_9HYPO|nr:hypothetical protein BBK36DRAFT_1144411 [Trichoderma citrinoviride]PTB62872.1 hypothetical protein BBK36DRAFT_1144411 [Trichoderma citrinoviride]